MVLHVPLQIIYIGKVLVSPHALLPILPESNMAEISVTAPAHQVNICIGIMIAWIHVVVISHHHQRMHIYFAIFLVHPHNISIGMDLVIQVVLSLFVAELKKKGFIAIILAQLRIGSIGIRQVKRLVYPLCYRE